MFDFSSSSLFLQVPLPCLLGVFCLSLSSVSLVRFRSLCLPCLFCLRFPRLPHSEWLPAPLRVAKYCRIIMHALDPYILACIETCTEWIGGAGDLQACAPPTCTGMCRYMLWDPKDVLGTHVRACTRCKHLGTHWTCQFVDQALSLTLTALAARAAHCQRLTTAH